MYRKHIAFALGMGAAFGMALPAVAQQIRIGLAAEPSSIDPHYHVLTPNEQLRKHIFESLTRYDNERRIMPVLATSWRTVDARTWEFKLRKDVKFHDGSPFTAQDVIYSLCRVSKVANSPAPFTFATRQISRATATDPHTLILETSTVYPLLPNDMSKIGIISAKVNHGESVRFTKDGCSGENWPETADFNNGKLAIGTGPYRFGEYVPGKQTVLYRNEQYWSNKPLWTKVYFRPLPSNAARMSALLNDEVDLIEAPPQEDVIRVQADPRFVLARNRSARVIFLQFDARSDHNSAIKGTAGNPLKDKLVREAISRAIDRFSISRNIMGGFSQPAWQLLYTAQDHKIAGWYDRDKAKALLAQAGHPTGFDLTLSSPSDRYVNDGKIAREIARMLTSVGIRTRANLLPANAFFAKRNKGELGFRLGSWMATTGEMSYPLRMIVATPDKMKGNGTANYDGYSNPAVDRLLDEAMEISENTKRQRLLQRASDLAIEDFAVIPIHYEINLWAMKKDIIFEGRWDSKTACRRSTRGGAASKKGSGRRLPDPKG